MNRANYFKNETLKNKWIIIDNSTLTLEKTADTIKSLLSF